MTVARRVAILSRLVGPDLPPLDAGRLCTVSAEVTGMTGAGIMLMVGDAPQGSVCATNPVSALIEQLQFTLGEGPCVDAYRTDRSVLEPDLLRSATARWPAFTPPAVDAGARAIFGFPVQIGSVRLGALNLYRDRPGPLSDDQHADALVMADVAAQTLLLLQANAPEGELAAELAANADFQYVVHQASGMVAVQLKGTLADALIRLRAHAFATGRPLKEIAEDVVARRLRFPPEDAAGPGGVTS